MIINLLNKIISLFISGQSDKTDMETQIKSLLINMGSLSFTVIVLTEAVLSLANESIELAIPFLSLSIILTISHLYLRTFTGIKHQQIAITVFLISSFTLLTTGGNTGFSAGWSVFFPFYATALRGRRNGTIWSAILAVMMLIYFIFIQPLNLGTKQYSLEAILFISVFYSISFITAFAFQFLRSEVLLEKDRIILETQNKNRALEDLISRLSHQIRTPLSNIKGIANIFETTQLTEDQKKYMETLRISSNSLTEVVNNLVMATKAEVGNTAGITNFNLYNTINSAFLIFIAESRKVKYSISLAPDVPYQLTGNNIKLKQILLNIFNSILKQPNAELTHITLEVKRNSSMPGKLDLSFIVISDLKHPELKPDSQFSDSFFNSQDIAKLNTNKMISLLDLGLTQKMIEVDGHHLAISLSKNLIEFKFTASFTTTNQYQENNNITFAKEKHRRQTNQKKGMKNSQILIVEDNLSNQQILTLYIKNHVKKVDIANNGKEALNKVATTKYDLILMDIQMPVMDGFKATGKIRELENTSDSRTPIIAVTANAFPEDEIKCLEAGMDSYISKPFNPDQLLDKMKHFLEN